MSIEGSGSEEAETTSLSDHGAPEWVGQLQTRGEETDVDEFTTVGKLEAAEEIEG